jgi:hypothetical protein
MIFHNKKPPGWQPWWSPEMQAPKAPAAAAPAPALGTGLDDLKSGLAGLLPAGWGAYAGPLGQSLDLASGLAAVENQRYGEASGMLRQQHQRLLQANKGMGQQEIDARMGRASDAATGQSLDNWKGLRDQLGAAGVTGGGMAAGLGGQIELGRLAQIQGSKRDIAIAEAERRSRAATDNFMASLGLGNFLNQSPSMLQLDQFNSLLDFGSNVTLGEKEIEASKYAANKQAKAGKTSAIGSIIGGILGRI